MAPPKIETPRGVIVITKGGKAELRWNLNFRRKWQGRYSRSQKWLDNEVLANCEPFVPMRTGMLIKSGILGTVPGEGVVAYIAPYARKQYFTPRKIGSVTGPLRGPFWFERCKALRAKHWEDGVRKLAGGGSE